ncbi:armadillo-type protein [Echria macrotheca]|uniref:Armadillo-type protein n=1 Tax=Echria macrotheca TaxID=438768 RepID=A0AAJ0BI30_9PEZI|nr:armadillo-type protein [Echria macrotheca]
MDSLPLPTSLDEVLHLVRALYAPNPPKTIGMIQEVLQRLQKSDQGWQLVQSLMLQPDNNTKFFAALTIIVKLNLENKNLSEDDAKELLQNTIGWTLQSMGDGTGDFVIKKLCSALVTHYIFFSDVWPRCVRQLLTCLDLGRTAPVEALDDSVETSTLVSGLDAQKMALAIHFATVLVEEVGKTEMSSPKFVQINERLVRNTPDVTCLLARAFDRITEGYAKQAMACYQAWILYAQRVPQNGPLVESLRNLVAPAMKCFPFDDLFEDTAGLFTEVLQNYSTFLTKPQQEAVFTIFHSQWGYGHYSRLKEDAWDRDAMLYGMLMLAYGEATVQDLITSTDPQKQSFLGYLVGILNVKGYLVSDDPIFVNALDFWSVFVETMVDTAFSNEGAPQPWRPYADDHLRNVVMHCWQKIQWPPVEEFAQWDSADRQAFVEIRKDVIDMLQSLFTLNGVTLVSYFVNLYLESLQKQSWAEVEATLYCLGGLSDCVTEEAKYDNELSRVFSLPFFNLVGQVAGPIPLRLRQTGLSLIEKYCEYFERHSEFLPHSLNLLFAAIEDSALRAASARSISTLCSSCRSILTGEAATFINHYRTIRSGQVLDSITEEKIVHAIACIIQAIQDETLRLTMFEELYGNMSQDVERAAKLKAQPDILDLSDPNFSRGLENWSAPQPIPPPEEIAKQIALRALRCISSMAKGMQDIQEHVVELDSDTAPVPREGRLAGIQAGIVRLMVAARAMFDTSGEIAETICNIFKAGFSETEPGPFVFPPDVVTDYFVQQPVSAPRLGTTLSTACSFIGSLYRGPRMLVPSHLARLLPWAISILQSLPEPESDTEITQNAINLVEKILPKYPSVVFEQPSQLLEFFFLFTLRVLDGKEPLPKGAAADFWSVFISLKLEDPALQSRVASAMEALGPLFTNSLIRNIGGNAMRSELDKLSDPLKKLVVQQSRAQMWLESALRDLSSSHVTAADKSVFLKRVLGLRGARQTNQVVRDFWLACRGSNFAYVS